MYIMYIYMIYIFQKQRQISVLTFSSRTEYVKRESIVYIVINAPCNRKVILVPLCIFLD